MTPLHLLLMIQFYNFFKQKKKPQIQPQNKGQNYGHEYNSITNLNETTVKDTILQLI